MSVMSNFVYQSFDNILLNRVGFGTYQMKSLAILSMIGFMDGSEMLFSVILPHILKVQWKVPEDIGLWISSAIFFGAFLGTLISGLLSDIYGRKKTIFLGSFLECICFLYTFFTETYEEILITRFFFGFSLGITIPMAYLIIVEIIPQDKRGRSLIMLQIGFTLGQFYFILLATLIMDETLVRGDWKKIVLCNFFIGLVLLYFNYYDLDETARYLIVNRRYDEGIEIIDKMGQKNNVNYQIITENERNILVLWRKMVFNYIEYPEFDRFINLYNKQNFPVTIRLMFLNINMNFVASGMAFLTPLMIRRQVEDDFELLFLMTLSDVPAILIVYFLVDIKNVGRLRLLYSGMFISLFALITLLQFRENILEWALRIFRTGIKMSICIIFPLLAESYNTVSMGISIGGSLGKLSSGSAAFLLHPAFQYDIFLPYYIFVILLVITFSFMYNYPFDTTQQELDIRIQKKNLSQFEQEQLQQLFTNEQLLSPQRNQPELWPSRLSSLPGNQEEQIQENQNINEVDNDEGNNSGEELIENISKQTESIPLKTDQQAQQ